MLGKGSLLLGRYRIVALLGEGGMAAVYRAVDERLEREVAIKVLSVEHFPPAMIEQIRRRFAREARLLARLSHPHIVPIYDYGEWEGAPFLVMAYLSGGTLKDRLKAQGKLAWREALQLLLPVTEALAVAHEHGIVHRDVKPANILFDRAGRPYIGDFGVAKIFGGGEDGGTTLTGTGMAVGTPHYMAPEQWEGEAGPQTDVYALGVVLYEMLMGTKPYDGRTPAEVYRKQLTQPLPSVGDTVPREVARLLAQALQRDPAGRFADMRAMAQAMEKALAESGREKQALAAEIKPVVEHGAGEEKVDDFETVVEARAREETAFETVVDEDTPLEGARRAEISSAREVVEKEKRATAKADEHEGGDERGKIGISRRGVHWIAGMVIVGLLAGVFLLVHYSRPSASLHDPQPSSAPTLALPSRVALESTLSYATSEPTLRPSVTPVTSEPTLRPSATPFSCPFSWHLPVEIQKLSWKPVVCDTFNDNLHGWDEGETDSKWVHGTQKIRGGYYKWQGYGKDGFAWWSYPAISSYQKFYLSVQGKINKGSARTCVGLWFGGDEHGFWEYYICKDGEFGIWKNNGQGGWVPLKDLYTHRPRTSLIRTGDWNQLSVWADGERLHFYLNGDLLDATVTSLFSGGRVGVMVESTAGQNFEVLFDDFLLMRPAP